MFFLYSANMKNLCPSLEFVGNKIKWGISKQSKAHRIFRGGPPNILTPLYALWRALFSTVLKFAPLSYYRRVCSATEMRFSEEQSDFYIWFVYAFRCSGVKFHGEYLCHLLYRNCFSVNPFVPNASFIYPLKTLGANGLRGYC